MISVAEFRKVKLRVGRVLEVSPHPDADRLYVLRVDLGPREAGSDGPVAGETAERDVRTLVAGVRAHYEPAALLGRSVVVVANLEPATIRGVASDGMLLAAVDREGASLLMVDRPVDPGAPVT